MNTAITISGPIGPWTCGLPTSIIVNGRKSRKPGVTNVLTPYIPLTTPNLYHYNKFKKSGMGLITTIFADTRGIFQHSAPSPLYPQWIILLTN